MEQNKIIRHHKKDICPICGKLKDVRSKHCYRNHETKKIKLERIRKWQREHPEKTREKSRQFAMRRREWVAAYKAQRGCQICFEKDPRCLDFHHRNPKSKIKNVGQMVTHNMEALLREIEKCDLLCANCHRKKGRKQ